MAVLMSGRRVSSSCLSVLGLGRSNLVRLAFLGFDLETQDSAQTRRHHLSLLELGLLECFVETDLYLQGLLAVAKTLGFDFVFMTCLSVGTCHHAVCSIFT
jgi:hypothetical protein